MDEVHRQALLALARQTLEARLTDRPLPTASSLQGFPEEFGGAFVTLRNRGELRGCMGRFKPVGNLPETIQQMSLTVLDDPRFQHIPVTPSELPQINIEISVLSRMIQTDNPLGLQPGVHGIYIRKGLRDGCFLPQVASEQGWNAEQFLSFCCQHKAGLPPKAWNDPDAEVYLFTAEVFGEDE